MGSNPVRSPLTALVYRLLPRLRYPYLFLIMGILFLVDLIVPDPIPLVDEVLLALLTFLVATFTTRREPPPPPRDVTPPDDDGGQLDPGEVNLPKDAN
jgi:hypothetical protein